MKRLSKQQLAARDELVQRLNAAKADINEAINNANNAIAEYNSVVADVETFKDEIKSEMEDYEGERSDKWRESDVGSNFQDWMNEWDCLDVSAVDDIEEPDMALADDLEALPEESA